MKKVVRRKVVLAEKKIGAFFSSAKSKILGWSLQQKLIAGVTAFAVVLGGTTTGVLLHNAKKPVEQAVEPEVVEEVKVEGNKVEVPTFNQYTITTESMVKDLKIYFTDAEENRISGVPFSVIMTTSKQLKSIEGFDDCVKVIDADTALIDMLEASGLGGIEYTADLSQRLDQFVAERGGNIEGADEELKSILTSGTVTDTVKMAGKPEESSEEKKEEATTETTDATAAGEQTDFEALVASGKPLLNAETEQPLTIKEFYLVKKQNDIVGYQALLEGVGGKVYTDDDSDGIIKIEKIDGGDYIILCNPQNGFDTATYETKATVKAELEYKKVKNIKKEVVKDAGDTQPAEAAPVEAKLQDTVGYFKSSKTENYSYTAVGAPAYKVAPSNTAATSATEDGGSVTVSQNGGTLYALKSADASQMAVSFKATPGTGNGTFSAVDVTSSNSSAITVSKTGDGTYTIATASGTKSTSGTVTFKTTYTYNKASSSSESGNTSEGGNASENQGGTNEGNNGSSSESQQGTGESGNSEDTGGSGTSEEGNSAGDTQNPQPGAKRGGFTHASTTKKVATATHLTTGSRTGGVIRTAASTTPVSQEITVTVNIKVVGAETKITAADGTKLYSAQDTKSVATLGDVDAGKTLYTATKTVLYTGWQSIGGKSYYYKDDHTFVTGEQVIQGVKYTFGGDGVLIPSGMGVDVSKWQGKINWDALAPNISFAIIRCGYRGSSGGLSVDPQYARNMQQAKAHGVRVGIYIYSKATNEAMAVEEASLAVQLAQEQGGVSLPIYMDMEDGTQKGLSKEQLTSIANAFCQTVANSGYRPGVYASYNWWNQRLDAGSISASKWVARYNTQCGMACDIWQYSSKGTLPGIGGNVDVNQSYF